MIDRKYIVFDPSKGYPAGTSVRYECGICGDTVASMPENAAACKCRNLIVDSDAGRIAVKDSSKMKAYIVE